MGATGAVVVVVVVVGRADATATVLVLPEVAPVALVVGVASTVKPWLVVVVVVVVVEFAAVLAVVVAEHAAVVDDDDEESCDGVVAIFLSVAVVELASSVSLGADGMTDSADWLVVDA